MVEVRTKSSDENDGPTTVIGGRYVLRGSIARGGGGVIYRVEHVHTGEQLAMKILDGVARLDPQAIARFKREARTASSIKSEHIVRVTDADTARELDGSPFIVMELLSGVDLETYAVRHGPLAPGVLVLLLAQVCSVLEQAHRIGIVHRDLKPANLFLHERPDGTVIAKVLDFGISKVLGSDGEGGGIAVTSTGAVLGTPLYMAPEQANGHNDQIAPTTDVWAIGLLAMRLLTGEHYWGTPTMAELMMKILADPLLPPSKRWPNARHMSVALDTWFLRSCAREQEARWPTVTEQLTALAAALDITPPKSTVGKHLPVDIPLPQPAATSSLPEPDPEAQFSAAASHDPHPAPPDAPSGAALREPRAVAEPKSGPELSAAKRSPHARARNVGFALILLASAILVPWAVARLGRRTPGASESAGSSSANAQVGPETRQARSAGVPSSVESAATEATSTPAAKQRLLTEGGDPATAHAAAKLLTGARTTRPTDQRPKSAALPASSPPSTSVESSVPCRDGEVFSFGHCCPPAHIWQSGRCMRPFATSF